MYIKIEETMQYYLVFFLWNDLTALHNLVGGGVTGDEASAISRFFLLMSIEPNSLEDFYGKLCKTSSTVNFEFDMVDFVKV